MKKVKIRLMLASLLFTVAFLMAGATMATAQVSATLNGGQQGQVGSKQSFISVQVAKQKIQAALPGLYSQLNSFVPGTTDHKKKDAEVLAYKVMLSELNQGKNVSDAYNTGVETLKGAFNMENAADRQQFRTIQKQMLTLLTTP